MIQVSRLSSFFHFTSLSLYSRQFLVFEGYVWSIFDSVFLNHVRLNFTLYTILIRIDCPATSPDPRVWIATTIIPALQVHRESLVIYRALYGILTSIATESLTLVRQKRSRDALIKPRIANEVTFNGRLPCVVSLLRFWNSSLWGSALATALLSCLWAFIFRRIRRKKFNRKK